MIAFSAIPKVFLTLREFCFLISTEILWSALTKLSKSGNTKNQLNNLTKKVDIKEVMKYKESTKDTKVKKHYQFIWDSIKSIEKRWRKVKEKQTRNRFLKLKMEKWKLVTTTVLKIINGKTTNNLIQMFQST